MNLTEVEKQIGSLDLEQGFELIYDLLRAYGLPRASISRVQNGSYNKSSHDHEVLWKGKVFYRMEGWLSNDDLIGLIEESRGEERITRHKPRFLILRNEDHLVARDQTTGDTLDIDLADLAGRADFFLPWAGIEKSQIENANIADVKAAEKMAKLYDEIVRHNEIVSAEDTYSLNVFFSRLLFCFFAEDTEVFTTGQFTGGIASLTQDSGEDTGDFLERLFAVLDTDPAERSGDLPGYLRDFGYVNGSLFSQQLPCPRFTAKARSLVLDCGTLDWAQINPDIFGSMIQAVVHPGQRAGLGMHYTSVENIMKVIRPLFLDQLDEEYTRAEDSPKMLQRLLDRISQIKVFDPACGSGNFLVISYKELRKLEHRILGRVADLEPHKARMFDFSRINLESFYGIEIDGFAHEIAMLSLWLAKHQMNLEFEQLFGVELGLIPLKDGGQITHGNATRIDWTSLVSANDAGEIYTVGNPPYLGARLQDESQKADIQAIRGFGPISNNLDYVAAWWLKGADFAATTHARVAFVCTNSITQGEQVSLLWPLVFKRDVEIAFGVESFPWNNNARGNAGVTCVVVGIGPSPEVKHRLFSNGSKRDVESITPYLTAGPHGRVVHRQRAPISALPPLTFGSMPNDGGHLVLTSSERDLMVAENPETETFIRSFLGASEYIRTQERYVLWIEDAEAETAKAIPPIADRISAVQVHRSRSKRAATKALANVPHRFGEVRHRPGTSIIVPSVSSERREYIPMGFLDEGTVISNAANAIYDAEPWVFGLVQSRMHMVWVRAVAGRLKNDYRYSAVLVYNTFPVPDITEGGKTQLQEGAVEILAARERYSGNTLAELYDPEKMPNPLREAHQKLDQIVDSLYRKKSFDSDEERLELLFAMYSKMTADEEQTDA